MMAGQGVRVGVAVVLALCAGSAAAQCVTADMLAAGVAFTRADGKAGSVVRVDDATVQIDYRAGDPETTDVHVLRLGVYPVETRYSSAPQDVIGVWYNKRVEISYTGRFAPPAAGEDWETRLRLVTVSDDQSGVQTTDRARATATYRFLDAQQVTIGGCEYRMIPVEATIAGPDGSEVVRSVYFPDLGFAIETQVTDLDSGEVSQNGLTALRPAS